MRRLSLMLAFLFAVFSGTGIAEDKPLDVPACYQAFSKYSPKDVVAFAQKARDHILKDGKAALADFNKIGPYTFESFPYSPPMTVLRCDEMRGETFFLEQMYKEVTSPDYLKKFVDAKGEHTFVKLCSKVRGGSNAAWVMQEHFWIGCDGPLTMGVLLLRVPGTPYFLQSSLTTDKYKLEDFEAALK